LESARPKERRHPEIPVSAEQSETMANSFGNTQELPAKSDPIA
jgi:hypothetical protein